MKPLSRRKMLALGWGVCASAISAGILIKFYPLLQLKYGRLPWRSEVLRDVFVSLGSADLLTPTILDAGEEYLNGNPNERSVERLLFFLIGFDVVHADFKPYQFEFSRALHSQILAEARLGDVVVVRNLIVARSEARICALLRLLSGHESGSAAN